MSDGKNKKTLMSEIIKNSNSDNWEDAKLEWLVCNIYNLEDGENSEQCLCGHTPIREICHLKNRVNNNIVIVGNVCVKKFLKVDVDTNKIFTSIKRIKKDINKSLNKDAILYYFNIGTLNEKDKNFYFGIYKKRSLSERQLSWKKSLNEKVLNSIISESIFNQASGIKPRQEIIITRKKDKFNFTGLVRGEGSGFALSGYQKKNNVYYQTSYGTNSKINISEKLSFAKSKEFFKLFQDVPQVLKDISKEMLQEIYNKATNQNNIKLEKINQDISKLKTRKDNLLNTFIDGDISKNLFNEKSKSLEKQIMDLEKEIIGKTKITSNFEKKLKSHIELLFSAYQSYSILKNDEKIKLFKTLQMSFILNFKKELYIAQNSPYKALENLLFHIWYSGQRGLKTIGALYEYVAKNRNQVKFDMGELKDAMVGEYAF